MNIKNLIAGLNSSTPGNQIAAIIDAIKHRRSYRKILTGLLDIQHPVYLGRSSREVDHIRGYLFASFREAGVDSKTLPFLLATLQSELEVYPLAGAAIGLRGLTPPIPDILHYLLTGLNNIKSNDDAVSFETYVLTWPLQNPSSGLVEILKTLQWMGGSAISALIPLKTLQGSVHLAANVKAQLLQTIDALENTIPGDNCCTFEPHGKKRFSLFRRYQNLPGRVANLILENQEGKMCTYGQFFHGKPSVVVFFYTRCDNPYKCSLTISRLSKLQNDLQEAGLADKTKIAAITYDPFYDQPLRLKAFCENRGMVMNQDNCAFRIENGNDDLLHYFSSEVNFIGSIVNNHSIELYVIDACGKITGSYTQLQWDNEKVIRDLKTQEEKRERAAARPVMTAFKNVSSAFLSLAIIFFPKCPFCWAAYFSFLGISNISLFQYSRWLMPVLVVLLTVNLYALFRGANKRNGLLPFYLSCTGIFIVLFFNLVIKLKWAAFSGTMLILAGAVLNSIDPRIFRHFIHHINQVRINAYDKTRLIFERHALSKKAS
ncbi:MAG: SCO family protein [Chitinophagaceae bacterium]